jgi:hypothetical protein
VNLFPEGLSTGPKGIPVPTPKDKPGYGKLPGETAGEEAKTEEERIKARVAGTMMDSNARSRVQAGLADPIYTKMGRAFLKAWDPDRALPDTAKEFFSKRNAQNSLIAAKLWQEAGSNYGKNGSPLAEGESLEESTGANVRPADTAIQGLDAQKMRETYRQYMRGKFNSSRSAKVIVKQLAGKEPEVTLLQSSGDLTIDRAAIEDIRAAIRNLGEEDEAFKKARVSVWLIRLQVLINPPVPVIGVSFDEELNVPRLDLPLGRKLFKHVELEAVYDDDARMTQQGKPPTTVETQP